MLGANIKIAIASIRSAKWRSLLTMLGIIIGVVSVVTTVSLGEGVKKQVASQINSLGSDLITIRPGKTVKRDSSGKIVGVNFFAGAGLSTLTEQDVEVVKRVAGVKVAVPLNLITGVAKTETKEFEGGFIIGTTSQIPELLNQKVEFGEFFNQKDESRYVAIIGRSVANELFGEFAPIGKTITIRGQSFIVRGVLQELETSPLTPGADFNAAIFIPYNSAKSLTGSGNQIYEILVKGDDPAKASELASSITTALKNTHGGEEDFSVLKQEESLSIASNILNYITSLITGIAAISLLVGGIGIMNIMLVAVSERTHEIGIRKAVGATNRQILGQFFIEAIVLSIWGGIIGIVLSAVINILVRISTSLQPVMTLPVILLATGVSVVVGIIFGITPALTAAKKDPIQALRYE